MRMLSVFFVLFLAFTFSLNTYAKNLFNHTGLPIPRFVSLASDEINARKGPGKKYPIALQYQKKDLPVEIIAEYEHWRKIKDPAGQENWVHKSLLLGDRYGFIKAGSTLNVYKKPKQESHKILKIEGPNTFRILKCKGNMCRISIQSFRGWVVKDAFFGVYPDERLN